MRIAISIALAFFFLDARAATVDTVSIYSAAMKKEFRCVVIKPDTYIEKKAFPAVYLLHGHGGSYWNWIRRVPELAGYADQYQVLIVCPDGTRSSWYLDSPVDSSMQFETYIAKEVPAYIEGRYNTIRDRRARAITGLSMGGHGGLFLGFRHPELFGACGSMSGALNIEQLKGDYELGLRLGDTARNGRLYRELSVMKIIEQYPRDSLAIIIDCGTEDFLIGMSRNAHQKMLSLKIPHEYIERPGKHDWKYWGVAIQYQLLFFRNYFDRKN